MRSVLTLDPWF